MCHHEEIQIGEAAIVLQPKSTPKAKIFLVCEHASNRIPAVYNNLGITSVQSKSHIAWDIGAVQVTRVLSNKLISPAVLGSISRLVIDFNRQPDATDIIVEITHGIVMPGNIGLKIEEREIRFKRFYNPYHEAIHQQLLISGATVIVSIHSFSYNVNPVKRDFDIGLLYDEDDSLIRKFAEQIEATGLRVRFNEPYSAKEDIISSAQIHGRRHRLPNVELEINQRLINSNNSANIFAQQLLPAIEWVGEAAQHQLCLRKA